MVPTNTSQQHLFPRAQKVSKQEHRKLNNHHSPVLWFTGLSGSGKSTISGLVQEKLFARSVRSFILDGDNIRSGLNTDLGFSLEDRSENIRRVAELSKLFSDSGIVVLSAFISPLRESRDQARELVDDNEFIEVYVKCSLEECENRDVKGLYKKAREGIIQQFTGIDSPYEEPHAPELILNTATQTPEESATQVIKYLEEKGYLQ